MAKGAKGKKGGGKEKKAKVKKSYKMHKIFQASGDSVTRKNPLCPKCNVYMAVHKNRTTCGKCNYTEMK